MEWLNDGVGLIVVIASAIIVLLIACVLSVLLILRNKIAVQRLNFLGFYATNAKTRERYAECTIGNRSLNEVALTELGIKNGKVSFDLTGLYKKKAKISAESRVVIEQRSSIRFSLTREELISLLIDGKKGKELKTLRLYAVDLTGTLYKGKINSVRKLLGEILSGAIPSVPLPAPAEEPEEKTAPEAGRATGPQKEFQPNHPPVVDEKPAPVFPPVVERKPAPEAPPEVKLLDEKETPVSYEEE